MAPDPTWIRSLPKVELHTHLEGTLLPERIGELAAKAGVLLPRSPEELFQFQSLAEFLELIALSCGLVRDPSDAEQIAYEQAVNAACDGVVYQEVMLTPMSWGGLPYQALVQAVGAGYERAHRAGHADCRVLATMVRRQTPEEALEFVRWIGDARPARVVGIGLEGDEANDEYTSGRFEAAYVLAGELGLGRTAHTGESSGPNGVRDALKRLRVSRLDHGIRAAEDPSLLEELASEGIACNVCLSSNLALVDSDLRKHPLPALIAAGVPVTVNTDDWVRFGPVSSELAAVSDLLDWEESDLVASTRVAVDVAFCDSERKAALHRGLDEFVNDPAPGELPS
jgi:adenosine deaminase